MVKAAQFCSFAKLLLKDYSNFACRSHLLYFLKKHCVGCSKHCDMCWQIRVHYFRVALLPYSKILWDLPRWWPGGQRVCLLASEFESYKRNKTNLLKFCRKLKSTKSEFEEIAIFCDDDLFENSFSDVNCRTVINCWPENCPHDFFYKMGKPWPLFHLFSSFQTHITMFTTNKCEKMSVQYMVPGFELMTLGTWVPSHNH